MGFGFMSSSSTKQKVSSRRSTGEELITVDDKIIKVMWTKRFTEAQGFKVILNIVLQGNTRTIKLEKNEKLNSGNRTRHLDIHLFQVTYLISRKGVTIKHCPTGKTLADYFSKPLVGKLFRMIRRDIMNAVLRE